MAFITGLCKQMKLMSFLTHHSLSNNLLQPTTIRPVFNFNILQNFQRNMASLGQMHRNGPHIKRRSTKQGILEGRPQLKGVVLKVLIKKPKKPNSANRKCVRVRLSTGKEATAYIPGIGHNLQEHSIVLVEGHRVQDVPGIKLRCVRGKYDLAHVIRKPM